MPFYTADAMAVWFTAGPSGGSAVSSSIHRINVNGSNDVVAVDTPGVTDFYPIRDTIGQFLYSRTISATNLYGQVYMEQTASGFHSIHWTETTQIPFLWALNT